MAIIGIGIDIWTPSINGGSRVNLPPGQAILFSRGNAVVSFVGAETAGATLSATGAAIVSFISSGGVSGTLSATGVATVAFVGATSGGGGFTPAYQFNDARNSMYATHV
jgi:hypothetical protein